MASNNIIKEGDQSPRIILHEPTGSTVEAVWKPPKPVRGGIPICFPQFAKFGTLEQHRFARNRLWLLDDDPSPLSPANNQCSADLLLKSTDEDLKTWP